MKLLYCRKCGDAFNLSTERTKSCSCGRTQGKYLDADPGNAEYSGDEAIPFAVDNFSFFARSGSGEGSQQANDFYDSLHGKGKIQCWILREGNPNFETIKKIEKEEPKAPPIVGTKKRLSRCG